MNLNAPKTVTFIVSLVLALLAIVSIFVADIPFVGANVNAVWLAVGAWVVLAAGNMVAGL